MFTDDIDTGVFLALTHLARKKNEGGAAYAEALASVKSRICGLDESQLIQLALEAEEHRNREILKVVHKVAPYRKVVGRSTSQVTLECGHAVVGKAEGNRMRCRRCLLLENNDIARNHASNTRPKGTEGA